MTIWMTVMIRCRFLGLMRYPKKKEPEMRSHNMTRMQRRLENPKQEHSIMASNLRRQTEKEEDGEEEEDGRRDVIDDLVVDTKEVWP